MTLYEGIQQLLPGDRLQWKSNRICIDRYWDYPEESPDAPAYNSTVQSLQDELRKSIESRLVSDVPVGMFLSGGVDSNALACFVPELRPDMRMIGHCGGGDVDTQNLGEGDFSFARRCADHVDFDFQEVRVAADEYQSYLNLMLDEYATPLSTLSDVILYRLAQETNKSVGVVLGGEGADELLC